MSSETSGTEIATVEQPFASVLATQQSKAVFLPENLAQAMELAHFMAGGIGVRQWMRGNPSACLALIQISMRWGMDPYIVANKAYYANDTLSFESQLVNAVINTSGEIVGRLKVEFTGDATGGVGRETLNCRVSGRLKADPDQLFVHEQPLQSIKIRNSPLWISNPKQQLQYYTTRAWARLYMPEVLLGIYTPDEITDGAAARIEAQSTPKDDTPAPDRRDFVEEEVEDGEIEEITTHLPAEEEDDAADEPAETSTDAADAEVEEETAGDGDTGTDGTSTSEQGAKPVAAADEAARKHILDTVPIEPLEWAAWKTAALAEIEPIATRKQFDSFRRRIASALEQADDALLTEIQDLLTDKLTSLPEEPKK
jgi:hypothetical protein